MNKASLLMAMLVSIRIKLCVTTGIVGNLCLSVPLLMAMCGGFFLASTAKAWAQQPFSVIHTFDVSNKEGVNRLDSSLVQGKDGILYGTSEEGGTGHGGTVFTVTTSGNVSILHSFDQDGYKPTAALVEGKDGNFYGTTSGGVSIGGEAFKITPSGQLTLLYNFCHQTNQYVASTDGRYPSALIQASDGNFYGTTVEGGKAGKGTIFRLTPSGEETILHSFDEGSDPYSFDHSSDQHDGLRPSGPLIQASDGNFYGVTKDGGEFQGSNSGFGVIYKITPSGKFTVLHQFGGDGEHPGGSLTEAKNGSLYGVAGNIIYSITSSGEYHIVHVFSSEEGNSPGDGLLLARDGHFYGLLNGSDPPGFFDYGGGVLFRMTLTGSVTKLHTFPHGIHLSYSSATQLVQGNDSCLYGVGIANKDWGSGFIFRYRLKATPPSSPSKVNRQPVVQVNPSLSIPSSGTPTYSFAYSFTPQDADAKLAFYFDKTGSRHLLNLFTTYDGRHSLQSWSATSDNPVIPTDIDRLAHLLTLLYWQTSFIDPQYRKGTSQTQVPFSPIDTDEANKLYSAPAGLPIELLKNVLKTEDDWYQAVIQQILTDVPGQQDYSDTDQHDAQKLLKATGQGRDVLQELAKNLDRQAVAGKGNRRLLRNQAHYLRKLAVDMKIDKNQDHFTFKVPASVASKVPHSWLASTKNGQTIALGADKVLILVNLLTTFTQKLAVSAEQSEHLNKLLDYAVSNNITLDPAFTRQAHSIIMMSDNPTQIILDTFLDTSVDWIKSTSTPLASKSITSLSSYLATQLIKASPEYSGYLTSIAKATANDFAVLFVADAAGDVLFNTSGTFTSIKTAEYSKNCSEQFNLIYSNARTNLLSPTPTPMSLTSWAMAAYFHERSVANYHTNYANLLEGGRAAKFLGNILTQGGVDANIEEHKKLADHVGSDAEYWMHPNALGDLIRRYHSEATHDTFSTLGRLLLAFPAHATLGQLKPLLPKETAYMPPEWTQSYRTWGNRINFSGSISGAFAFYDDHNPRKRLKQLYHPDAPLNYAMLDVESFQGVDVRTKEKRFIDSISQVLGPPKIANWLAISAQSDDSSNGFWQATWELTGDRRVSYDGDLNFLKLTFPYTIEGNAEPGDM